MELRPRADPASRPRSRSRRGIAILSTALAAALGASALPAALDAQARVRSARLAVELGSDGGASVTIDYELVDVADVREVEVALLGFDAAATDEILADGRVLELEPASGSRRAATLGLAGAAGDGPRSLRLTYRIAEAVAFRDGALRARVPVATVSLPPAADSGDVFHARLTLPRQWSVVEGFPSRLVATESGVYGTDLRVVPSVVSLRGRTDGSWRPGVKLLIDLLTVAILAGVAIAGWRHMREMAA